MQHVRLASVVVLLATLGAGVRAAPAYRLVDLGRDTTAEGLNNAGVVAGSTHAGRRAGLYRAGRWQAVGEPGVAALVGDAGEVVISAQAAGAEDGRPQRRLDEQAGAQAVTRERTALPWPGGERTTLLWPDGTPGPQLEAPAGATLYPAALGDGPSLVGTYYGADDRERCAVWKAGAATELGTPGAAPCHAAGINRRGQVAGSAAFGAHGAWQAFIWTAGVFDSLGTLGGISTLANGLNDLGHAAVTADLARDDGAAEHHAAFYDGRKLVDLGPFEASVGSRAAAINNRDELVGTIEYADAAARPFLYTGGHAYALETLVDNRGDWVLADARAINDAGVIAANGFVRRDGVYEKHGLMLVPVVQAVPVAVAGAGGP